MYPLPLSIPSGKPELVFLKNLDAFYTWSRDINDFKVKKNQVEGECV
jgi:hypothetical protein